MRILLGQYIILIFGLTGLPLYDTVAAVSTWGLLCLQRYTCYIYSFSDSSPQQWLWQLSKMFFIAKEQLLYYDLRPVSSLNFLISAASSDALTRKASLPTRS